jgi:hypothetical protein
LDEQERQQNWLKAAEFFARMGTTPGGVLRGGIEAAKETLPELAKLRADQIKIRENYANIQANIDEADRLEKLGLVKDAEAIRERTEKEENENRRADEQNKRALAVARITAAANVEGHRLSAEAQRYSATQHSAMETNDRRAYNAFIKKKAEELGLPPNHPRVEAEAYAEFSGAKNLAEIRASNARAADINKAVNERISKDSDIKMLVMKRDNTKDPQKRAELDAKIAEAYQKIRTEQINQYDAGQRGSATPPSASKVGGIDTSNPLLR